MPDNEPPDDALRAAIKLLIARGRRRGYVTYDELNQMLPEDQMSWEQIKDVVAELSENGITLVDVHDVRVPANDNKKNGAVQRPVCEDRIWAFLPKMQSQESLSREAEIAIARRIEAGREEMLAGLCESTLTVAALLSWAAALSDGRMRLRDIGHLEAEPIRARAGGTFMRIRTRLAAAGRLHGRTEEADADRDLRATETFERIAELDKRLSKARDKRLFILRRSEKLPPRLENRYEKLKDELFQQIRLVRFNNARIEQLVDRHYDLNRRLLGLERKLLDMAERCGVGRREFLSYYYGRELDPHWVLRVKRLPGAGWASFADRYGEHAKAIRKQIAEVSEESRLPVHEFRRLVTTVKTGEREASKAKTEMVEAHLHLVISVARNYAKRGLAFKDLIEAGTAALMKAVDSFDYRRGQPFSVHAESRIRAAIVRTASH